VKARNLKNSIDRVKVKRFFIRGKIFEDTVILSSLDPETSSLLEN